MTKPDYAKWMLDDPRVSFAISTRGDAAVGALDRISLTRQVDAIGRMRPDAAEDRAS